MTDEEIEVYRKAAQDLYTGHGGEFSDGDINVDENAVVSASDEGAYVAAWVWISSSELDQFAKELP